MQELMDAQLGGTMERPKWLPDAWAYQTSWSMRSNNTIHTVHRAYTQSDWIKCHWMGGDIDGEARACASVANEDSERGE